MKSVVFHGRDGVPFKVKSKTAKTEADIVVFSEGFHAGWIEACLAIDKEIKDGARETKARTRRDKKALKRKLAR